MGDGADDEGVQLGDGCFRGAPLLLPYKDGCS